MTTIVPQESTRVTAHMNGPPSCPWDLDVSRPTGRVDVRDVRRSGYHRQRQRPHPHRVRSETAANSPNRRALAAVEGLAVLDDLAATTGRLLAQELDGGVGDYLRG